VSTNVQGFYDMRGFRIGVIAILAVAVLAGAAFWFGTGLRADTSQSVARSPLGSSLTAVRESQSVARSPLGSSLTAAREIQSVARSPLGSSLTAVRVSRVNTSSAAASASRLDDYFGRLSNSSAAASASRLDDYFGRLKPATVDSRLDDYYGRWSTWAAPGR
jgi:hypothetical protein